MNILTSLIEFIAGEYNHFREVLFMKNACYSCNHFSFMFVEDGICKKQNDKNKCCCEQKLVSMFDKKCKLFQKRKLKGVK